MVSIEKQRRFYTEELEEIELKVKETFYSPAKSLFDKGELFIGVYKGIDAKRGNVFLDIKHGDGYHAPRVDQLMNCFLLSTEKRVPNQWASDTYYDLLDMINTDKDMSETKLVDYMKSDKDGWIRMILNNLDLEFANSLQLNQVLGLGPIIPPFEYLINLKKFTEAVKINGSQPWDRILNFDFNYIPDRKPKLIDESIDIAGFIINEVDKNDIFIFQGPPGTGKTHQIADVVSRLANKNKSVLVTALTNKAAVEACEKPFLRDLMLQQKVSKTNLSSSEISKFPKLVYAKEISPVGGKVLLATYYQFSKYWKESYQSDGYDNLFDYVIVEEASQAFLTTIAAALKVGKKVIVVGDPFQIQPIVQNQKYEKISENINLLVNGLQTICNFDGIPFFRKIETRRLTARATDYTNIFYQNTMISKSLYVDLNSDINELNFIGKFIHPKGGPTLILKKFNKGKNVETIIPFLVKAIDDITSLKKGTVAVLTPFVKTLIYLQKTLKTKTSSKKYLIDTVDRVQGLDVDYCFYVMPDSNYSFSFKLNRFNVATSRSKKATFIIADKDFYRKTALTGESGNYLTKLLNEYCFIEENGVFIKKSITKMTNAKSNQMIIEKDEAVEVLTRKLAEKGLINIDGYYNSLLENNETIAEAEFVIHKDNVKLAVDPFSEEDSKVFKRKGYVIMSIKDLKKRYNL